MTRAHADSDLGKTDRAGAQFNPLSATARPIEAGLECVAVGSAGLYRVVGSGRFVGQASRLEDGTAIRPNRTLDCQPAGFAGDAALAVKVAVLYLGWKMKGVSARHWVRFADQLHGPFAVEAQQRVVPNAGARSCDESPHQRQRCNQAEPAMDWHPATFRR